jgi:hypothetical protein
MSRSVVTVEGSRRDLTRVRDPEGIGGLDVRGRGIKSLADLERGTPCALSVWSACGCLTSGRSRVCGRSSSLASCVCAESRLRLVDQWRPLTHRPNGRRDRILQRLARVRMRVA